MKAFRLAGFVTCRFNFKIRIQSMPRRVKGYLERGGREFFGLYRDSALRKEPPMFRDNARRTRSRTCVAWHWLASGHVVSYKHPSLHGEGN